MAVQERGWVLADLLGHDTVPQAAAAARPARLMMRVRVRGVCVCVWFVVHPSIHLVDLYLFISS